MAVPKIRIWAEYACPWSYIAATRLRPLMREYGGRIEVEWKALPLEWVNDRPTPRAILEQEWWIAALHEPAAKFAPYTGETYPGTTLPAFEAAACARMQGADSFYRYDLLVREAFFGRSLDISDPDLLLQLAGEAGLDTERFERDVASGAAAERVRADYEEGVAFLDPKGSPSFVLPDDSQVYNPAVASLKFEEGRLVGVSAMPCLGRGCASNYRYILDRAQDLARR